MADETKTNGFERNMLCQGMLWFAAKRGEWKATIESDERCCRPQIPNSSVGLEEVDFEIDFETQDINDPLFFVWPERSDSMRITTLAMLVDHRELACNNLVANSRKHHVKASKFFRYI